MALLLRTNYEYFAPGDNNYYVTRVVARGDIDGNDLVSEAAEDSTISKATMYAAMAAVVLQFKELLLRGYIVELPGVGRFRVSGSCTSQTDLDSAGADSLHTRRILYTPDSDLKDALYATDCTTEYGNSTNGIYKTRSAYAAALGSQSTDADTDEGSSSDE